MICEWGRGAGTHHVPYKYPGLDWANILAYRTSQNMGNEIYSPVIRNDGSGEMGGWAARPGHQIRLTIV